MLMLKLGRLYRTSRGFDLFASLECNLIFTWNKTMKQACIPQYLLYSISEEYCTNFMTLFFTESTYFHHLPYISLRTMVVKVHAMMHADHKSFSEPL